MAKNSEIFGWSREPESRIRNMDILEFVALNYGFTCIYFGNNTYEHRKF